MKKAANNIESTDLIQSPESTYNDDFVCFTPEQAEAYVNENNLSVNVIFPQNYIDFDNIDDPLQQQIEQVFAEPIQIRND